MEDISQPELGGGVAGIGFERAAIGFGGPLGVSPLLGKPSGFERRRGFLPLIGRILELLEQGRGAVIVA